MDDDLDSILRRVAAGELTPEQALPLIDAAKAASSPSGSSDPAWGTAPTTPPGSPGAAEGAPATGRSEAGPPRDVRISVNYRSLDVVADPSVDTVAVSGGHTVRRDGDTLVVESTQFQGFVEFDEGEFGRSGGAWSFLPRSTAWARSVKGQHVTVRVNPSMPITIDCAGSSLRVSGCEGGSRIRVVATSLKLDRVRGPLELDALTSSVKGSVAITGTSRISAESSSVKLVLQPGTDVRVSATANRMGKIVLPGTPVPGPNGQPESVLGDGSGRLVVDGVMSSIALSSDVNVEWATA
jgi:hypothetical protein